MRKNLLFLLILSLIMTVIAFALTACEPQDNGNKQEPTNQELFDGGLEYLGRSRSVDYYRDTVSDVMYLIYIGPKAAGMTQMSDPETGLPLTYTRYLELQNQSQNK